jgi:thiol-disulfide isomerase/thioredoxin
MKSIISFICIATCIMLSVPGVAQPVHCRLEGTTIGRTSNVIILVKETEDARFTGISIPVVNNRFEYEFTAPCIEKYNLDFKDELDKCVWYPIKFFPCEGTIHFTLYPLDSVSKDKVEGGELNAKMNRFDQQMKERFTVLYGPINEALGLLYKSGHYYSDTMRVIDEMLTKSEDKYEEMKLYNIEDELKAKGEYYSPRAAVLESRKDSITRLATKWQNEYISSNVDLFSYSLVYDFVKRFPNDGDPHDLSFIVQIYPVFARKFPSHPYTKTVGEMLTALSRVRVGNPYLDFSAPTIDGREIRLSEEIAGKVALIDLWASWCGSCRALNERMIPVYEKYKDKGFVIIGVACEYKNTDRLKKALTNDNYPWMNLVDLDNSKGIWGLYNLSGAGGCTYLVDASGKIVAIHPDAEELDRLLSEMLK